MAIKTLKSGLPVNTNSPQHTKNLYFLSLPLEPSSPILSVKYLLILRHPIQCDLLQVHPPGQRQEGQLCSCNTQHVATELTPLSPPPDVDSSRQGLNLLHQAQWLAHSKRNLFVILNTSRNKNSIIH